MVYDITGREQTSTFGKGFYLNTMSFMESIAYTTDNPEAACSKLLGSIMRDYLISELSSSNGVLTFINGALKSIDDQGRFFINDDNNGKYLSKRRLAATKQNNAWISKYKLLNSQEETDAYPIVLPLHAHKAIFTTPNTNLEWFGTVYKFNHDGNSFTNKRVSGIYSPRQTGGFEIDFIPGAFQVLLITGQIGNGETDITEEISGNLVFE